MRVSKWGNSLAIRLPAALVEKMDLKDGDSVEIRVADSKTLELGRSRQKEEALMYLREHRQPLPSGFAFDRNDANER